MSRKKRTWTEIPSVEELMRERTHERYRIRYRRALRSTITTIITVAAAAIIVPLVREAQLANGIELYAPEQYERFP